MIDKVKNYTNLFVIASPLILSDEALLNDTCDYAFKAGLYFLPAYYQDTNLPINSSSNPYIPALWFAAAKERYGDRLLGIYFYDEPSGSQLDKNNEIIPNPVLQPNQAKSYLDYANYDFWLWTHGDNGVQAVANFTHSLNSTVFTSDYGLYWFDYELGYDTILAQFGWNNSRPLQIALTRGAAAVQNKTWGATITWTFGQPPYLESGAQMYNDMVLAYDSGASYIAVYDSSQNYTSTTLKQEHFDALKEFWTYVQHNPGKHGSLNANTALVLPQDYGFGFRTPTDSVWQYHQADNWTQKLYSDVTNLINQYGSRIDIVYSDPEFQNSTNSKFRKILYWPKDFETNATYQVTDPKYNFGYNSIQEAISSFATYEGDTLSVKPGTYQENIAVTKPVSLTSQNKETTIIYGSENGSALTIASDNVTVTGFTAQNGGNISAGTADGIVLDNAHNCSLIANTVASSHYGILLNDSSSNLLANNTIYNNYYGIALINSSDNILRGNDLNNNTYNLVIQNGLLNNIDSSNMVDGKPYSVG